MAQGLEPVCLSCEGVKCDMFERCTSKFKKRLIFDEECKRLREDLRDFRESMKQ